MALRQGVKKTALKNGVARKPTNEQPKLRAGQRRLFDLHVKALQKAVRKGIVAGIAGTAIYKGKTIYRRAFGLADLERRTPFRHDTICRIYCSSKPVIGFAAMMMCEQGSLDLDAPVHKYIPSFKKLKVQALEAGAAPVAAKKTMTVRHLLLHTGGLGYGADFGFPPEEKQKRYEGVVEGVEIGKIQSLAAFVDEVAKVPLYFQPGERYEYSYSTDILGRVLEVASGQTLDKLLKEKIFAPLGMKDTSFFVPAQGLSRLAGIYGNATTWEHLHERKPRAKKIASGPGLLRIDGTKPEESHWAQRRVKVYAGGGSIGHCRGGLVSTAADTEAWVRMLLAGGMSPSGDRLVSKQTLAELERNQLTGEMRIPGTRWCLLGDLIPDGGFQQGGAAGNYWLIDRKRDIAMIIMMQQVDGEDWEDYGIDPYHADLDKVLRQLADAAKKE
eukprot:CAMPEP_0177230318 /NCGR_PEP_ID=MMETSP0367-20130122/42161_1 /TAXON_ID=447022 ORGANISM="Scrippsiella hangoei-like, Strain SHHI-4" /NCGR_SAMPLE_ID=MMETSP0367 /ASSEMBLY_ACC=CAM_ASM_000362 /LENGTH=442 /DNA_ID=CAMNT_0018680761 /DNA_START=87 /DNA_END=1413 /DNA_ORIENTATION=+